MTADLSQLFEQYYPALVRMLYRRTGDRDRAEDLAQETFARAVSAPPDNPRPWLFAVALNLVREDGRRAVTRGRRLELLRGEQDTPANSPDVDLERREEIARSGPRWRRSTNATARRCCSGPKGSIPRRSPPRWAWPRARSARRWPVPAAGWSKPTGRRSGVGPRIEGRMSHLDEGTLHALLDGELETHEVAEIQAHLGSCSSCGLRLREVKEFHAEADRLIASIDAQAPAIAASRPTPVPFAAPPPRPQAEGRREPPA